MALGETVGRAYVRILADGTGLSDDIKQEMRKNEPAFEKAGNQTSKAFKEGFNDEIKKKGLIKHDTFQKAIQQGAGRVKARAAMQPLLDKVRVELERRFGEIGLHAFTRFQDQFAKGKIDLEGIKDQLENNLPAVLAKATKAAKKLREEIAATDAAAAAKSKADLAKLERDKTALIRAAENERARLRADAQRGFNEEINRDFRQLALNIEKYNNSMLKGRSIRKKYLADIEQIRRAMPHLTRDTVGWAEKLDKLHTTLRGGGNAMRRFENQMGGIARVTGKVFGKGSRNDLLNFFGTFMSIIPRLGEAAGAAGSWVLGLGQSFLKLQKDAGGGAKGFGEALKAMATQGGLPGLIAAASLAVTAIGTIGLALGPLASGLVMVTGVVLALAGSLAFALVGGLVAVAGALVPFAAMIGVGALAIAGLQKATKSAALKEFKKDWEDLQKSAATEVFGKNQKNLEGLSDILKGIEPVILAVAGALGDMMKALGEGAKSPAFLALMTELKTVLPGMVTTIGSIGGNLGVGLGQAFVAAEPLIKRFLGWLDDITAKFADFGKGGKDSKLRDFFAKAETSAVIVFDLIESIGTSISTLFGAGKETGDSIFQKMADTMQKVSDKLIEWEADGTLDQFFTDAGKVADKIGEIVVDIEELIAALDTAENRAFFIGFLGTISSILDAFTWLVTKVNEFNNLMLGLEVSAIEGIAATFADLKVSGGEMWTSIVDGFNKDIKPIPGKVAGVVTKIVAAAAGLATKFIAKAGNLGDRFGVWVQSIPGKAKTLALKAAAAFANLAGNMITKAGSIASKFATWVSSLPGKAKAAASSIANGFSGLAGDMIAKAGSIASKVATWLSGLYAKGLAAGQDIARGFSAALSGILSNISLGSLNIPEAVRKLIPGLASGGIVFGPHVRMIGEAGPEAVVPLNRPLSMVDPAVRELSAIAQGLHSPTGGTDVNTRANRTLVGSITIITPTEDPRAVASEVIARMAGASYL